MTQTAQLNTRVSALILAGSRGVPDPVAVAERVAHKALVQVGGAPMLQRVIAAVRDAGIDDILVSADEPEVVALAQQCGAEVIAPGPGPSASVAAGFARLGSPMLVTTSDHPLLKGDWIRTLVTAMPMDADVALMLARRDTVEQVVPEAKRTWLRFANGQWTGCNLFLLARPEAGNAIAAWAAVEANRKRPWRLAMKLGLRTLLDYMLGRLKVQDAILRLGRRMGVTARMVAAGDGLAAIDVDKPSDLATARRYARRI